MSGFRAHVAQLARAAETATNEPPQGSQTVVVPLSETAQSLPAHIIAATDPVKLNQQAPIFRCPAWAGLPSRPYHLQCVRAGELFPALGLHRFPYYLFGKNPVCDFVLEHPSVSSVHAVLIFNKEHECFVLLDLGSTNGTRLQGKRVEPRKPVPIAVGSVLQFGYSTRTYELRAGAPSAVKRAREETEADKDAPSSDAARLTALVPHAHKAADVPVPSAASDISATQRAPPLVQPTQSSPLPTPYTDAPSSPVATVAVALPPLQIGPSTEVASTVTLKTTTETSVGEQRHTATAASAVNASTTSTTEATTEATAVPPSPPPPIHLFQLVIKHKDVDNPVSRGHNKGEVITRSKADALDMVRFIAQAHEQEVAVDAALGFSPWTVEEFVAAVREFCEVSGKKKIGDLGMVEKGTFSDAIDDAAFRLRRGEVSAPVETQLGVHLLFRCD